MPVNSADFVTSLDKGLAVLHCFDAADPALTISEVARKTGFSRATARRFLLTFVTLGYAVCDGKHFMLAPKVLTLGQAYLSSLGVWESSRDSLEQFSRRTGQSSSVGVLDASEIVYVVRAAASHSVVSVPLYVGARLAAHATSMGQILLAYGRSRDLSAFLARRELTKYTEHTITEPRHFRVRLRKVREQGFALVEREFEPSLVSMAVPLTSKTGTVLAALNVSATSNEVTGKEMVQSFLPQLKRAAAQIEAGMLV